MRVGDEVKLKEDKGGRKERGVVVERLAGSWLLVKRAAGAFASSTTVESKHCAFLGTRRETAFASSQSDTHDGRE